MKKSLIFAIPLFALASLSSCGQETKKEELKANWTVLTYICATDLETDSGCYLTALNKVTELTPNENVNFVVQIGGTSKYGYNEAPGILKDVTKTYRYSYKTKGTFTKEFEGPLTNMSEPDTLSSFIKWGKEKYPAKHYELLLCDHGGGAYYGFSLDSLYCDPRYSEHYGIMSLDEVEDALEDGGVHFDIVNINACEMMNIETMQAVHNHADYLVGHEECSSTGGDSLPQRVEYLFKNPSKEPLSLATDYVDMLGNGELEHGVRQRTLSSLIDLSKTTSLTESFNAFWKGARKNIADPNTQNNIVYAFDHCDRMTGAENRDLKTFLQKIENTSPLYEEATKLSSLIDQAVFRKVAGDAHKNAGGISFYHDRSLTGSQLDHLMRGEQYNPEYMAYIDDITTWWSAPASLYTIVEKTDPTLLGENLVTYTVNYDNIETTGATLKITSGKQAISKVEGMFYVKVDGNFIYLGKDTNVQYDASKGEAIATKPLSWGHIVSDDGETKNSSVVTMEATQFDASSTLYNIPIDFLTTTGKLTRLRRGSIIATLDNASTDFDVHGICTYVSEFNNLPDGNYVPWPSGSDKGRMRPLYYTTTSTFRRSSLTKVSSLSSEIGYDETTHVSLEYSLLSAGSYGYMWCVTDMYGREITPSEIGVYRIN